jgi:hypothetical protein
VGLSADHPFLRFLGARRSADYESDYLTRITVLSDLRKQWVYCDRGSRFGCAFSKNNLPAAR